MISFRFSQKPYFVYIKSLKLIKSLIRSILRIRTKKIDSFIKFYPDSRAQWLSKKDVYLTIKIIQHLLMKLYKDSQLNILEIGVWEGAWSETILRNSTNTRLIGVDPYPGGESVNKIKTTAIEELSDLIKSGRFQLYENYSSLSQYFSIIHIDGRHTEAAVEKDLNYTAQQLNLGGVIIVDDFKHHSFPGVASALFKFLHTTKYRIFMVSEQKAYICHENYHSEFYNYFLESCSKKDNLVNIIQHYSDKYSLETGYIQETDVKGYPVLLCLGEPV